jgi:hypothetical protein
MPDNLPHVQARTTIEVISIKIFKEHDRVPTIREVTAILIATLHLQETMEIETTSIPSLKDSGSRFLQETIRHLSVVLPLQGQLQQEQHLQGVLLQAGVLQIEVTARQIGLLVPTLGAEAVLQAEARVQVQDQEVVDHNS